MQHICSISRLVFGFLLLFSFLNTSFASENENIHIGSAPHWVQYRTLSQIDKVPVDDISDGIFYRLVDNQIKISPSGKRTSYSRYAQKIVNQKGIEESSQINISFDPSYQKLVFNTLYIIRNGERIDRLTSAKISLFNSEDELEKQIYNGSLTLNILIDDIREGDTLDYSYTRFGANPVYQGIFAYSRILNWSVPVHDQFMRVLWGKKNPLYIDVKNISVEIEERLVNVISSEVSEKYTQYQVHQHNVPIVNPNSQTPGWFDPYGVIYFTESENWQAVVQWAKKLYPLQLTEQHPSIVAVAEEIKSQTDDISQQISSALIYAQSKIRYVGLEMGTNSHFPTPAHETLALRYGDCKDKALFFISVLDVLGVKAYPALVDTEQTKLLQQMPPAVNRFNHVLVSVEHEGKQLWLDPTLSYQQGELSALYQPDYGYALVLKSGEQQLTSMASKQPNSYSHINETFIIPEEVDQAVTFSVTSEYFGNMADKKRNQMEQSAKKKITEDYEIYYQDTYSGLTSIADIEVTTDKHTGAVTLAEFYRIENFWQEKGNDFKANFYPEDVRAAVYKPKQINRKAPLAFTYPNNIINHITVVFTEENWEIENESFVEDNPFFFFKATITFKDNTLDLHFDYRSKTDHIPADKIDDYLAARKRLREEAYYGIIKYGEETKAEKDNELKEAQEKAKEEINNLALLGITVATAYMAVLVFIIGVFQGSCRLNC